MARKQLTRTSEVPYHITARSNNKDFFYVETDQLWQIFMECLAQAQKQFSCEFHAFVLMSNHYHLLVSTPNMNIDSIMQFIQREVAKRANKKSERINHFFGGPYKWSLVREEAYYWNALKYIFRNPIRAGMCLTVNDYKYSSLNSSPKDFRWKLSDFFNDKNYIIKLDNEWLNEPFLNESESNIRVALRRKEFTLPRDSSGHRATLDMPHFKK